MPKFEQPSDYSVEKKEVQEPSLKELRPGGLSQEGFLEKDQTLEQVINRDKKALEILGYTAQEVADLLGSLKKGEYTAPNGKKYIIEIDVYRGKQECPWEKNNHSIASNKNLIIKETGKNAESVRIAGLLKHLIKDHEFFEGGAYRVAPEQIIEMFGFERIPGSIEQTKKLKI